MIWFLRAADSAEDGESEDAEDVGGEEEEEEDEEEELNGFGKEGNDISLSMILDR